MKLKLGILTVSINEGDVMVQSTEPWGKLNETFRMTPKQALNLSERLRKTALKVQKQKLTAKQ